jgi:hypothetical protein
MERRSERGGQLKKRKRDDVYHQRRTPPEAIRNKPEKKRAYWAHREGEKNRLGNRRYLRVEIRRDCADAKYQDEKIEGVQ